MYVFDIDNKSVLKDILLDNLKSRGVRGRLPKKLKENEKENECLDNQVFQKPLHMLRKCVVQRIDGSTLEVPEFLIDACSFIEKNIKVEGIFRKAGSTCKLKERKLELNQGKKVSQICEYHVLDACSLVKLFFRELPQGLIPCCYHDIFLKCLLLSTYEKEVDALLLATLLLPEDNLATLAFFMEFLLKVSQHEDRNKMNVKNLAIILAPTLMPANKGSGVSNSFGMASHFKVLELLIENAVRIGKVPDDIIQNLTTITAKKQKKKRRSRSLTRMFTGLKKIVTSKSSGTPEWDESVISTPESIPSLGKRKATDLKIISTSKKKKLTDVDTLTPLRCRMQGYVTSSHLIPSFTKRIGGRSPTERSNDSDSSDVRSSRLNLVRRCPTKRQKYQKKPVSTSDLENLLNQDKEKPALERNLSLVNWNHEKSFSSRFSSKATSEEEKSIDLSDNEFITVPKSEYEDIKNRVSALEEDLEKLSTSHLIQTVFEKTLEQSEKLDDGTDQLARRLSKELNIRRSCELRSPSARKIGSIRRKSRNSEPKSNLKRGRPNTVQTGLPSPRTRTLSNENIRSVPLTRSVTFREEWKSGDIFFLKENHPKLTPTPQGRPSVIEIRSHNAGMVLEKAKLFNALNENKITRRQSVRLENLRRANEVTRARSFGSERKLSPLIRETPQRGHVSRRDTPSIKKPIVVRSPRSFAKTPMRSGGRGRATPMKALIENGTPHIGLRRSPRILARNINASARLRD